MTTAKLVDPESWGLAVHFLPSNASEREKQSLSEDIQQAVEDWFLAQKYLRESRKLFAETSARLYAEQDGADAGIMLWAQRHPRVCASNYPTGEPLIFGGRRQL
ncbi:MAG: hypothetical protein ACREUG_03885 [Steroidobacteraceae bacterium]